MIRSFKYVIFAVGIVLSIVFCSYATQNIEKYINDLMNQAFSTIKNPSLGDEVKKIKIREAMAKNLDFDYMAHTVLGRNRLPEKQVKEFMTIYKEYMLTYCTKMVKNYNAEDIKVSLVSPYEGCRYIVKTEIIRKGSSKPLKVDFFVKRLDKEFKIFNIVTENVSLVHTQSSEFNNIIKSQGYSSLIKKLKLISSTDCKS